MENLFITLVICAAWKADMSHDNPRRCPDMEIIPVLLVFLRVTDQ